MIQWAKKLLSIFGEARYGERPSEDQITLPAIEDSLIKRSNLRWETEECQDCPQKIPETWGIIVKAKWVHSPHYYYYYALSSGCHVKIGSLLSHMELPLLQMKINSINFSFKIIFISQCLANLTVGHSPFLLIQPKFEVTSSLKFKFLLSWENTEGCIERAREKVEMQVCKVDQK